MSYTNYNEVLAEYFTYTHLYAGVRQCLKLQYSTNELGCLRDFRVYFLVT